MDSEGLRLDRRQTSPTLLQPMQIFGNEILGRHAPPSQDIVAAGTLLRKKGCKLKTPASRTGGSRWAITTACRDSRWPTGAPHDYRGCTSGFKTRGLGC